MEFWQVFATGSVVAATGLSFLLLAVAPIGKAQEVVRLRLQCDGTFSVFSDSSRQAIEVRDVHVEISGNRIEVLSAPGFGGTYSIINLGEDGVGFQADTNTAYSGFLTRINDQFYISIAERNEKHSGGNTKYKQALIAVCKRVHEGFYR